MLRRSSGFGEGLSGKSVEIVVQDIEIPLGTVLEIIGDAALH